MATSPSQKGLLPAPPERPEAPRPRQRGPAAFFTLVGCHGQHVTLGLIWLVVMMVQVAVMGFVASVQHRLLCFSLFWHALDIVWVGFFTVVELMR